MKKMRSILAGAVFAMMAYASPTLYADCGCGCPQQSCPDQSQCIQLPCDQKCCGLINNEPTCNWTPIQNLCYGPCQPQPQQQPPMQRQPMMPQQQMRDQGQYQPQGAGYEGYNYYDSSKQRQSEPYGFGRFPQTQYGSSQDQSQQYDYDRYSQSQYGSSQDQSQVPQYGYGSPQRSDQQQYDRRNQ